MDGATLVALAGTGVAALSVLGTVWSTRKTLDSNAKLARDQRNEEMMLTALGYFIGGSQNRTVGLAALQSLRHSTEGWERYRVTVAALLHGQLLYVLGHGRNRWETHEAANIQGMATWLLDAEEFRLSTEQLTSLEDAMDRYRQEWAKFHDSGVPGGRPDPRAVERVIHSIPGWVETIRASQARDGREPS